MYKRYIDDILVIWPEPPQSLYKFVEYLNKAHPTIKFTCEVSTESIDFLDMTIYKGSRHLTEGKLDVKPFFKKTNKFQYLEYGSSHPRHTFKSVIKGELTRLLRACSDPSVYEEIQLKMSCIFRDRKYPSKVVREAIASVPFTSRQGLLNPNTVKECTYETFMVLPYTPDLDVPKLRTIINREPTETESVPRPCLSLNRKKNVRQTIVRAKIRGTKDPPISTEPIKIPWTPSLRGNSAKCGRWGCKCCRTMSCKLAISSTWNHKSFNTAQHSNCDSNCVIYLLECQKCTRRNQYVGQTQRTFSLRVAGHRQMAKKPSNRPLYKHFAEKNHNFERDAKFSVLEKTRLHLLSTRETHWIDTLETTFPKGTEQPV